MIEQTGMSAALSTSSVAPLLVVAAITTAGAAERSRNPLADHVRAADDRFKDEPAAVSAQGK